MIIYQKLTEYKDYMKKYEGKYKGKTCIIESNDLESAANEIAFQLVIIQLKTFYITDLSNNKIYECMYPMSGNVQIKGFNI